MLLVLHPKLVNAAQPKEMHLVILGVQQLVLLHKLARFAEKLPAQQSHTSTPMARAIIAEKMIRTIPTKKLFGFREAGNAIIAVPVAVV